tara:strand:+ start:298 stop:504 length:207 start_codon:yes stop_codon:yes gene_type:complete
MKPGITFISAGAALLAIYSIIRIFQLLSGASLPLRLGLTLILIGVIIMFAKVLKDRLLIDSNDENYGG